MVVGIRNPQDGEEYVINAEGLKAYEDTEEEKAYRAKLAAEGLLNCTQVTDVSAQIQKEGVRLPDGTFLAGKSSAAELLAEKGEYKEDPERRSKIADCARNGTIRTPMKKPTQASIKEAIVSNNVDDDGVWLEEAYWVQATFECSQADGCMDVKAGDWIWIQFEGRGESYGWLYGTDPHGLIAGWVPGDIASADGGKVTKHFTEGPAAKGLAAQATPAGPATQGDQPAEAIGAGQVAQGDQPAEATSAGQAAQVDQPAEATSAGQAAPVDQPAEAT